MGFGRSITIYNRLVEQQKHHGQGAIMAVGFNADLCYIPPIGPREPIEQQSKRYKVHSLYHIYIYIHVLTHQTRPRRETKIQGTE